MEPEYKLLGKHINQLKEAVEETKSQVWSWSLPVFILDRSWFKLIKIKLYDLPRYIYPDNSKEAPELIRYKELLNKDIDPLIALQECWHEYGIEDFHRALRNSSNWEKKGNNGWTFQKYSALVTKYREYIDIHNTHIPLIILGRNQNDDHILEWINDTILKNINIV